jgi:hypothetical protein
MFDFVIIDTLSLGTSFLRPFYVIFLILLILVLTISYCIGKAHDLLVRLENSKYITFLLIVKFKLSGVLPFNIKIFNFKFELYLMNLIRN